MDQNKMDQNELNADQVDKKQIVLMSGEDLNFLYDAVRNLPIARKETDPIINILSKRVYSINEYLQANTKREEETLRSFIKTKPTLVEMIMKENRDSENNEKTTEETKTTDLKPNKKGDKK